MVPKIKIFAICGSPIKGGNTETFLKESLKVCDQVEGVEYEWDTVAGKEIKDCNQCNWCITKAYEGKYCAIEDDMQPWFPKIADADAIILATPVYISRLSGYMANVLDRMRAFMFGNFRGTLKNKVGAALAVSWLRTGGIETALLSIYEGFLCDELLPVSVHHSGAFYGAGAFSSIGGTSKFDPKDKLQVLKDEWGLKQGRDIVLRVIEVARIVKAGKEALVKNGIDPHLLSISKEARVLEARKNLALSEAQYKLEQEV
ncbi:flavodoxin family protein [Calderihabitans maritimus]|uniref:NADPH-dependent FMN reductase n=1 Tax=Calderihabitans maritimus TaxID=1246530 RepID=A0A1Z5HWR9_9FIRM|nr:flavodoxin family protein [Calderihabitans maritimus]GAW93807.1 NADPH-dependent FMN reductase [Calderihabitans maritimus]